MWSSSITANPCVLRCVCGEIKYSLWRGTGAEAPDRQRWLSRGLRFYLLQAYMKTIQTHYFMRAVSLCDCMFLITFLFFPYYLLLLL